MNNKNSINMKNNFSYLKARFGEGLRAILHSPAKIGLVAVYAVITLFLLLHFTAPTGNPIVNILRPLAVFLLVAFAAAAFVLAVIYSAIPRGVGSMAEAFIRINLVNSANEPPLLARRSKNGDIVEAEFFTRGIPLECWENKRDAIESALNYRVTSIKQGRDKQYIVLRLAPGDVQLPTMARMPNDVPCSPSQLLLGTSLDGPVMINFNVTPHVLLAGGTGSGKTNLSNCCISQLLKKRDEYGPLVDVKLIDLKGGQDYPHEWRTKFCDFSWEAEDALSMLSMAVQELRRRQELFTQLADYHKKPLNCLDDFNAISPVKSRLRRIVIVIDEIAELTDTTGMDKPHKELSAAIIGHLATIARMGRASGINLIICTQRPDATIVPGQIKNNMSCRICGRAPDPELFRMILGDSVAAKRVPPDVPGRFVMQDGTEFQAYLF